MTFTRSKVLIIAAIAGIALVAGSATAVIAASGGKSDLARVKGAVAKYHTTDAAEAGGWVLIDGLDHCFENPGVGGMGVHYINGPAIDTELDPLAPEALVFQHQPNGSLHLGAVEYIVDAAAWDAANDSPPELLGQHLHLNEALGVYVLHAWIFTKNPAGMFEDWNPNVSCP